MTVSEEAGPEHQVRAFNRVVEYCTEAKCRRALLLSHFGEKLARDACSGCDFCDDPEAFAAKARPARVPSLSAPHVSVCGQTENLLCCWDLRDGRDLYLNLEHCRVV